MRTKKIFCILLALAMLLVSISPLIARNSPYPRLRDQPIAHPWQDDNSAQPDSNPIARIVVVVGGIFIGIDLPNFMVPSGIKQAPTNSPTENSRTYRSVNKRDYRGISNIVTPKGY